ncbi:prephenate dehydrogenase [Streptomyces avermitilis]|uniref:Prephenate dehydrogenase n=1 Tax=Streptomyces avermitilis TaxID=33903 RepID=A0A4D4M8K8_STRAX|nr:prephenate dehydrogenase [Streptomyces avermitilis]GDY68270.1 prephenate dehydrogenase [Streptomyces avermitilis]
MTLRTLAVVGTGLIGTSVALAASRRGVTVHLLDRDESAARTAAALGAGLPGPPPHPVDLAVIAVPPSAAAPVLAEAQARRLALSYTDVASVKAPAQREILAGVPDPRRYIGGHPLAGRERSGPLAARADLFRGRAWVLTPTRLTSKTAFDRALDLIALCGAEPRVMRARTHDDAVALTSHAPHLVASLMAARLSEGPPEAAHLAGQGLRDVTRIARGDSCLWSDIVESNAAAVADILTQIQEDLGAVLAALKDLAEPDLIRGPEATAKSRNILVDLLERGITGVEELDADPGRRKTVAPERDVGPGGLDEGAGGGDVGPGGLDEGTAGREMGPGGLDEGTAAGPDAGPGGQARATARPGSRPGRCAPREPAR